MPTIEELKALLQSLKNDDPTSISVLQTVLAYVLMLVPSIDEKAALAGTSGSPSDTNRYVTDDDPRLAGGPGSGITDLFGDVTATGPGNVTSTVTGLQNYAVSAAAPAASDVLSWNGLAWTPTAISASADHFAPKYVVGNKLAGDSATSVTAGGFIYIQDTGNGVGIISALTQAATNKGDIYLRPGTYTISTTLVVPAGVEIRGAGNSTKIVGTPGTTAGPVFSLADGSVLRALDITHNEPAASLGPQYGVVQLSQDASSALCEDVSVETTWGAPTNSTLFAGFLASNVGGVGATKLRCVRCSVRYGQNNVTFDYNTNLVGYRLKDASLELIDCTAQYLVATYAMGYNVVGVNSSNGSLVIRGGTYSAWAFGILVEGFEVTRMLVDGAQVTCSDTSGNPTYALFGYKKTNSIFSNCTINGGSNGAAIRFDPAGVAATSCKGSVIGNTINVGAPTLPWESLGTPSGYHVFVGNTYTGAAVPTTGPNDEAAHNINVV
jgi:hypothetical protein